jgi:hypothetical protein
MDFRTTKENGFIHNLSLELLHAHNCEVVIEEEGEIIDHKLGIAHLFPAFTTSQHDSRRDSSLNNHTNCVYDNNTMNAIVDDGTSTANMEMEMLETDEPASLLPPPLVC